MTKHLDTLLLRSFVFTAQCGSVGDAARALGMTQPGISKHVRRLEDVVGTQLLQRGPRGTKLTESGAQFLAYAHRMLEINDEALICFSKSRHVPKITIGVQNTFSCPQLSRAIAGLQKQHPATKITVVSGSSDGLRRMLSDGYCDLLVSEPDNTSPNLVLLGALEPRWLMAKSFNIKKKPLPLVTFSETCSFKEAAIKALSAAGIPWKIVFEGNCVSAVITATQEGLGVTSLMVSPDNVELLDVTNMLPATSPTKLALTTSNCTNRSNKHLHLMAKQLATLLEADLFKQNTY